MTPSPIVNLESLSILRHLALALFRGGGGGGGGGGREPGNEATVFISLSSETRVDF